MPKYEGHYVVKDIFSGGSMIITRMDNKELPSPINMDAVKKNLKELVTRKRASKSEIKFPLNRKPERAVYAKFREEGHD